MTAGKPSLLVISLPQPFVWLAAARVGAAQSRNCYYHRKCATGPAVFRQHRQISNRSHLSVGVRDNRGPQAKRPAPRRGSSSVSDARFGKRIDNGRCETDRNPPIARNKSGYPCESPPSDADKPTG